MTSRRSFLVALAATPSWAGAAGKEWIELNHAEPCMGTLFRVKLFARNEIAGYEAIRLAFRRARALDAKLSDYKSDSELSLLMREGYARPFHASDDLYRVLKAAQRLAAETHGAFDITIGPFSKLWRKSRDQKLLPSPDRIADARKRVGYQFLEMRSGNEVRLRKAGMLLDLGGIAKGFAADEMLAVLRSHDFPSALVVAGGEVAAGDAPPGRCGWRVTLEGSNPMQDRPSAVTVTNRGVSTSGPRYQRVTIGGVTYSHVLNPRTGLGLTEDITAEIIARTAMESDSLATAAGVLGFDRAMMFLRRKPQVLSSLHQLLECPVDSRKARPRDRGRGSGCGRQWQSPNWPTNELKAPAC